MRSALVVGFLFVASLPTLAAEQPRQPWSFAVLVDNRDDPDSVFPAIVQRIHGDAGLAFVIHLGDVVHSGGRSQLKDFLESSAPVRDCIFPAIRNHEIRRDRDRNDFKRAFKLTSTPKSASLLVAGAR